MKGAPVADSEWLNIGQVMELLAKYPPDAKVNTLDWPLRIRDIEYREGEGLLILG